MPSPSVTASFQFTPLREGRLLRGGGDISRMVFQFTPLREGRHAPKRPAGRRGKPFQFTPLREGRLVPDNPAYMDSSYFNSRPSARGDASAQASLRCLVYFNSRPSARGDNKVVSLFALSDISIHAPPRGATNEKKGVIHLPRQFQFTPLREGRLLAFSNIARTVDFNSRPSARGDALLLRFILALRISIHAPPRGAT